MSSNPQRYQDADAIAEAILARIGRDIVLLLPLALGKAVHIANALVDRACADPTIRLTIFTALSLERPALNSEIKRRFLGPAADRLFGAYPGLRYVERLRQGTLPENIRVHEFFLLAGQWLEVPQMQQAFISANFTHALSYLRERGLNVVAQLVAPPEDGEGRKFSLSCNPDVTADLLRLRRRGEVDFVFAGQSNAELPFMYGDAVFDRDELDLLLDGTACEFELFVAPKRPVGLADYAIGLHAARLVRDGGTIQIGIGSIGDAIVQALLLRHQRNDRFRDLHQRWPKTDSGDLYEDGPLEAGLYANSEMFVSGFLPLYDAGILSREVDGAVLHGAFFVDDRAFYERLRAMPKAERQRFRMMAVSFTNELFGDEEGKRAARVGARFINSAMKATLRGAIVSDAVEGGGVVSGVGGQYNFVAQAFALAGARSVMTLNATRQSRGQTVSNIVWAYGHETIPWHLRDIVVTEYGVADLRGKSEVETIAAMLAIADSRFQPGLLAQAKKAGKIPQGYQIPEEQRRNTPERIEAVLRPLTGEGLLPRFPFGTDFTPEEQRLMPALELLKQKGRTRMGIGSLLMKGLLAGKPTDEQAVCLERMGLHQPRNLKEHLYRRLLHAALTETSA
ncbi:acetyl-CoA hydrolase/transferase C-terminal domain-containing protein [Thiococcus pfennigii]|uniref:acetyl-CoA hydrolase/transferase C-terminal domain-containing protein n=1 Tax=Thiococcus pfennigii TaxID=1057 RepID=UPI0019042621|nr:acetyl-CoA hydrolase/transferase C-terminal domain-containing protein [Thiococcus pfennigii]MBK1732408.1 acetyl-CoA hydrolase [Thiococcus pfennigii]